MTHTKVQTKKNVFFLQYMLLCLHEPSLLLDDMFVKPYPQRAFFPPPSLNDDVRLLGSKFVFSVVLSKSRHILPVTLPVGYRTVIHGL